MPLTMPMQTAIRIRHDVSPSTSDDARSAENASPPKNSPRFRPTAQISHRPRTRESRNEKPAAYHGHLGRVTGRMPVLPVVIAFSPPLSPARSPATPSYRAWASPPD